MRCCARRISDARNRYRSVPRLCAGATTRRRPGSSTDARVSFGDVDLDLAARIVRKAGASVHLTPIEYRLLATLIAHSGKVLTHRHLLREVWGPSHVESHRYLRVYMGNLRAKLEDDPAQPKHLLTVTGVGYRLADSE